MELPANTAVVTGASGYIGTEIITQLLHKGYSVRATVRDTSATGKYAHLIKVAEAFPGELTFHEAQLGVPGSYDKVIKGANYVFHTAAAVEVATFPEEVAERQKLVDASVQSQLDIIQAAAASKDTVKRVIITSSLAAVKPFEAWRMQPYTEADWNTTSSLEEDTYLYLKTITEKKAFEVAEELGLSLVSILPSFVIGPVISDMLTFSPAAIKKLLEQGDSTWETGVVLSWLNTAVDVRVVARAHILAAEKPTAHGRYIVAKSHPVPIKEMVGAVKDRLPSYRIDVDKYNDPEFFSSSFQIFDTSKAQNELGLQITDGRESLSDMVVSMVQKHMIELEPIAPTPATAAVT